MIDTILLVSFSFQVQTQIFGSNMKLNPLIQSGPRVHNCQIFMYSLWKVLWNVPRETHCRIIALLSESAPLSIQLKARFLKFMCKALVHDISTLKLACRNPMSVSGRNWLDCFNFAQDITMISMNVKQVYGEWYDTVSDNEIDSVCILR